LLQKTEIYDLACVWCFAVDEHATIVMTLVWYWHALL